MEKILMLIVLCSPANTPCRMEVIETTIDQCDNLEMQLEHSTMEPGEIRTVCGEGYDLPEIGKEKSK